MPPPSNTPLLAPSPTQKLKRGYRTEFFPGAEEEEEEGEDASDPSSRKPGKDDMRQEVDRRERAALILGSFERLSWHSRAYGESIPQTRLRLQKVMIGLEPDSGDDEWEDEGEDGEEGKERETETDEEQMRILRSKAKARRRTAGYG